MPSFHDFQRQQKVKSLYRSFLRLAYQTPSPQDLLSQIRPEFRQSNVATEWDRKRALSEGQKRYKELSAMLGSSVRSTKKEEVPEAPPTSAWPWKDDTEDKNKPSKPLGLPSKTL